MAALTKCNLLFLISLLNLLEIKLHKSYEDSTNINNNICFFKKVFQVSAIISTKVKNYFFIQLYSKAFLLP